MREIKFRAWDKEKKSMSKNFSLDEIKPRTNLISQELMQFTGLKDKNGKEIYEGDIIKIPRYKTKECILLVKEISHLGLFLLYIHPYTSGAFWSNLSRTNECEIIGNKFENPELLGERIGHP